MRKIKKGEIVLFTQSADNSGSNEQWESWEDNVATAEVLADIDLDIEAQKFWGKPVELIRDEELPDFSPFIDNLVELNLLRLLDVEEYDLTWLATNFKITEEENETKN